MCARIVPEGPQRFFARIELHWLLAILISQAIVVNTILLKDSHYTNIFTTWEIAAAGFPHLDVAAYALFIVSSIALSSHQTLRKNCTAPNPHISVQQPLYDLCLDFVMLLPNPHVISKHSKRCLDNRRDSSASTPAHIKQLPRLSQKSAFECNDRRSQPPNI